MFVISRTEIWKEILFNFHVLINVCILEVSLNQATFLVKMFHINIMSDKKMPSTKKNLTKDNI